MACVACMEVPTKGKCILDGCTICCTCGRVIRPENIMDEAQALCKDALQKAVTSRDPDIETTKKNVKALAESNLKKILGEKASLVTIQVEADPDDPDAVTLQFIGPTELVEQIDAWNRKLQ